MLKLTRSAAAYAATRKHSALQAVEAGVEMERPFTRADVQLGTVSVESRTVEIVFATEAPVRRYNWKYNDYTGEYFDEVLSVDAAHVQLERINAGGPLLNEHNRSKGVFGVYGTVERAWIADGANGPELRAKVRFGKGKKAERYFQEVKDGIIRCVSVGYNIGTFTREEAVGTNTVPVYRATQWEPTEVSFVSVPADINSGIRSEVKPEGDHLFTTILMDKPPYKAGKRSASGANGPAPETPPTPDGGTQTREAPPAPTPAPTPAPAPDAGQRTAPPAPAPPAPTPAPTPAPVDNGAARAVGILGVTRSLGLSMELAEQHIAAGTTLDGYRQLAIDTHAAGDPNRGIRTGQAAAVAGERSEAWAMNFGAALMLRAGLDPTLPAYNDARHGFATITPQIVQSARQDFGQRSLLRIAEQYLEMNGVRTADLSPSRIAKMALGLEGQRAGMMSTSDFNNALGNTMNRVLRAALVGNAATFRPWTRRATVKDFRTTQMVSLSGLMSKFDKVAEGAEYKRTALVDSAEPIRVDKFGKIVGITWETIQNDDLDFVSRIPAAIVEAGTQTQSDVVYSLLLANPNLVSDGVPVFHATHKNLGNAATISVASMTAAWQSFRSQTTMEGTKMNLEPRYLVVGPSMEFVAMQFLSPAFLPNVQANINVFQNKGIQLIVDARIEDNRWYLMASNPLIDTIVYAFLDGEPEIFTDQRVAFEIDAYEWKARMVFGAAFMDYRGVYFNPGV